MLHRTYEQQICSIARALEVVGERWSLLIVRDALLGLHRFDQFQASLGVARNVLTDRLARLVEAGILARVPYQRRPLRHAYELTDKGRELSPVLLALMHWGDRHLAGADGPPRLVRHAGCGEAVTGQLSCARCGPVGVEAIEVLPGPALTPSG
jgi:DNA-binding HxlR family transcriptional regulator